MIVNALALVMAPRDGGGAGIALLIQLGAFFAIFWFLFIRPQRQAAKRHREMLAALKRGDEVMTEGGIIGEVVHLKDDRVTIRSAESTRLVVARQKIARVVPVGETAAAPPKQKS
ncbi:MAG: preprotein translocase subunit YajC [Gemmatimonadetes bacterium]|nr:preprotein translocase subunit YajC [Gemmatimonadota bacterium]